MISYIFLIYIIPISLLISMIFFLWYENRKINNSIKMQREELKIQEEDIYFILEKKLNSMLHSELRHINDLLHGEIKIKNGNIKLLKDKERIKFISDDLEIIKDDVSIIRNNLDKLIESLAG